MNYDVIIIGAGAAGMMCAIQAGQRGRRVLVLDHANRPGKKILMSGGGRCNFTNIHTSPENFISHNPHFCKSALSRYTQWDFIAMVEKHGIPYHEKTLGQLFCDHKSKAIVEMLLAECERAGARVQCETSIESIEKKAFGFVLKTNHDKFNCESLVIATGGLSIPTMGASPFGYRIAEQFGLSVYPTRAALVPLTLHDYDKAVLSALSGVSFDSVVTSQRQSFRENTLLTHRGLSGPAVLQISSYWTPGEAIVVNCFPGRELVKECEEMQRQSPNATVKQFLQRNTTGNDIPKRLLALLFDKEPHLSLDATLGSLNSKQIQRLADIGHHWEIKPNGTEGYRTAEVTLGGVDCDMLSSKTMECNSVSGLYFIGEVVDMTGWLGGYNFQWAWSSGWAAGQVV